MTISGILWLTSSSADANTLVMSDYIEVSDVGELYVTGATPQHPYAQRAEIFLRHEYCGKPEDGFDAQLSAEANQPVSERQAHLHGRDRKDRGPTQTAWSLLTKDSVETHSATENLITVDHCGGWQAGDVLSIAPTGGDQTDFGGVRNRCDTPGCFKTQNSKTESRTIQSVTVLHDDSCDVILTEPLMTNHRGRIDGIASPIFEFKPRWSIVRAVW